MSIQTDYTTLLEEFMDRTTEELITMLRTFDDAYYELEEPLVSDELYDAIYEYVKIQAPSDIYFAGVGATVRGGKVDLPHKLGSLTQVGIGSLSQWISKNQLTKDDMLVVTAKLDGTSSLCGVDSGLNIAYSRGDGYQGADITRHVKHFVKPDKSCNIGWVRGENIIAIKKFFEEVQQKFTRSGGAQYKNPRNAVAGLMNASENDPAVYQHIDMVAYDIIGSPLSKSRQLAVLSQSGFKVPEYTIIPVSEISEQFLADFILHLRESYDYEVDGVVIEVDDSALRAKIDVGNTDLNPRYAFKYKVADSSNYVETRVVKVEWNVAKTGYLKPRVIVEACALPGITWTYATGYNAKWILENGVGPGALVAGQRMGDVTPNIIKVIEAVEPQMPTTPFRWSDTGVDAISEDEEDHIEILSKQVAYACESLGFMHLGRGTIDKIVDYFDISQFDSFTDAMSIILKTSKDEWVNVIGANGAKIYDSIVKQMSGVSIADFAGSMPYFSRGIGKRKLAAITSDMTDIDQFLKLSRLDLVGTPGFDEISIDKVLGGLEEFAVLWESISEFVTIAYGSQASGDIVAGQQICMTGFRDKDLTKWIEVNGGKAQSGVSGSTTILIVSDLSDTSSKMKKALEINEKAGNPVIKITTVDQFKKEYGV